jgi:hypothetical protein
MRIGVTIDAGGADGGVGEATLADDLGVWAVEVVGPPGTEAIRAARIAAATRHVRIFVRVDLHAELPFTIAEEVAVLDNLSGGRIGAIAIDGTDPERLATLRAGLAGDVIDGSLVAPPPVQPLPMTWSALAEDPENLRVEGFTRPGRAKLTGDVPFDGETIDAWLRAGCTHLFVVWPGDLRVLARHLRSRAAMVDFPTSVADLADRVAPYPNAGMTSSRPG